jgi:hypothetical protein
VPNDLYFIPILARALAEPDAPAAFRRAFQEIQRLGQEAGYARGLEQFERFLEAAVRHLDAQRCAWPAGAVARAILAELIADDASDTAELRRAVADVLQARPEWRAEHAALVAALGAATGTVGYPNLRVTGEGALLGIIHVEQVPGRGSISRITPGRYELAFETGRVLWADTLTQQDLVWSAAFPGRPLELAADTGISRPPATRQLPLLGAELILRVFPGVESGRMEVEVTVARAP